MDGVSMTDAKDALMMAQSRAERPDAGAGVLDEASQLINGDRQEAYGSPEDNFGRWSNLCKASERERVRHLTPSDIAFVMVLGKISREANAHKRDNQVDAAAYLALYERLEKGA